MGQEQFPVLHGAERLSVVGLSMPLYAAAFIDNGGETTRLVNAASICDCRCTDLNNSVCLLVVGIIYSMEHCQDLGCYHQQGKLRL